jgi:hypothetical protein
MNKLIALYEKSGAGNMKSRGMILALILSLVLMNGITVNAAPDPSTVKKEKETAPLHIKGKVMNDVLFQDTTKDKEHPQQIRKMTISVQQVIKAPKEEMETDRIEVYYHYIPSWQRHEYVGGASVNVAIDDVIEIWLDKGEFGWEPALFGNTVEHLQYAENREEAIPEPFLHKLERISSDAFKQYLSMIVFAGMIGILALIIFKGVKRKESFNRKT